MATKGGEPHERARAKRKEISIWGWGASGSGQNLSSLPHTSECDYSHLTSSNGLDITREKDTHSAQRRGDSLLIIVRGAR